jgi:hypothetical protein
MSNARELREKVAIAIASAEISYFGHRASLEQCMNWANEPECFRRAADAAIAVALEEAARVADDWEIVRRLLPLCDHTENECARVGQIEAQERIAAAIRALIHSAGSADSSIRRT